jgi:hypothetical protein
MGDLAIFDRSVQTQRQKLRGKTGCLSCKYYEIIQSSIADQLGRHRRKKCDERRPVCARCAMSGRVCDWPNIKQLVDRRYTSHPQSRYGTGDNITLISLQSEQTAREQLTIDLEVIISRHFIEEYYCFLLLPNCHRAFRDGWIGEIKELMTSDESLRYSVLANAASHIHNRDANPSMQSISLQYYSRSLRGLTIILDQASNPYLASCNALLMSVMLLYLHGCMGKGTYLDIPPHLHAAMRVISLRLFETPITILRPFDHLALESVLYQKFLTNTVLWSDRSPLTDFDLLFWLKAEHFLNKTVMFPNKPHSLNSPVLGVPVALYRLAIQAKQACQVPEICTGSEMWRVHAEIQEWEAVVRGRRPVDLAIKEHTLSRQQSYYDGATHLYTLIISLLLEQATKKFGIIKLTRDHTAQLPEAVPQDTWQIQKALHILRAFEFDDGWSSCYVGNWPVYTIGFFLNKFEDIRLVRNEMDRRWASTKFMQIARFRDDLETTWSARGLSSLPF